MKEGALSAIHFGDMSKPVQLLFLHANGFNAQTYRTVLEPLPIHAVALDLRGHGATTLPYDPENLKDWYVLRDDIVAFVKAEIEGDFVLGGHSLGAGVAMLSAPELKHRLTGYIAFDPVTMPVWMGPFNFIPGWHRFLKKRLPIAAGAGRRRSQFESLEQAFSRYQGRGVFKNFPDQVLRDYLEGGLKPANDGVELACDPKWEQAIYAAQGHNLFKAARALPKENSRIIYAGKGAPHTPTSRERMRGILGKENVERHMEFHHMFPLNKPEFATGALLKTLKKAGLSV
jgi:pimeloyl-ACP methyl ester carboxylesterase